MPPARNLKSRRVAVDVATGVAIAGLLVTLVFNTFGVREQAKQARQTRSDTQIGLLTQLNNLVAESDRALNATGAPAYRCRPWEHPLNRDAKAKVLAAVQYYDYLAWLFNQHHITMQAARSYWTPSMLDAYELAADYYGPALIRSRFAELDRFKSAAPATLRPRPCG
jgi:hypothetical protein